MFKNAKVGDRVFSLLNGWGTVDEVEMGHSSYPISVDFDSGKIDRFTSCGKCMVFHSNPVLFWDEVKITPPEKPLPVDTPILVRDDDDEEWQPAHLARFTHPGVMTWMGGKTSHTTLDGAEMSWDEWKLPESENNK